MVLRMTIVFAAIAALVTTAVLGAMLRWAGRLPQATPGPRSLHVTPVPRVGGLALWAGVLPAVMVAAYVSPIEVVAWGPAWFVLTLVSLRDDACGVSIMPRLVAHVACALWFACWVVTPADHLLLAALQTGALALLVVWSLNLYNFMDGSDGLAALMAIFGFGAYALAGTASPTSSGLAFVIAAAAVPLFVANSPPARIFMGDVGAVPLGFLAAAFGIAGVVNHTWSAWFPLLVFLPFIADATLTLLRRIWRRERWWEGHRSHYYQRLLQLGAGHAGTLSIFAALMLGTSVTAVAIAHVAPEWGGRALAVWCVVLLLPFGAIDYHWRRRSPATP